MTTTQQERATVAGDRRATRGPWLLAGMVVIGLLIGLLGGWLLFGSDDVITVDGSTLTDRQAEMIDVINDDFAAWQDNDVDRALSYYTDRGTFIALGEEYLVEDGSLAEYVTGFFGAPNMEEVGPDVIVDGNTVITFHTYAGTTYTNIFTFTSTGDVLIVRHEVAN